MVTVKHSTLFENVYDGCKVIKLDCVGHVQKRMGKHLLNLKTRTEGKLEDGKPMGGGGGGGMASSLKPKLRTYKIIMASQYIKIH